MSVVFEIVAAVAIIAPSLSVVFAKNAFGKILGSVEFANLWLASKKHALGKIFRIVYFGF